MEVCELLLVGNEVVAISSGKNNLVLAKMMCEREGSEKPKVGVPSNKGRDDVARRGPPVLDCRRIWTACLHPTKRLSIERLEGTTVVSGEDDKRSRSSCQYRVKMDLANSGTMLEIISVGDGQQLPVHPRATVLKTYYVSLCHGYLFWFLLGI